MGLAAGCCVDCLTLLLASPPPPPPGESEACSPNPPLPQALVSQIIMHKCNIPSQTQIRIRTEYTDI